MTMENIQTVSYTDVVGNVTAPGFVQCEGSVTANCFHGNAIFNDAAGENISVAETMTALGTVNFIQGFDTRANVIVGELMYVEDIASAGNVTCEGVFIGNGALLTDLSYSLTESALQHVRNRVALLESKRSR
jgi:hypothetical protein